MTIGAFKYWYTLEEAAQAAAHRLGEPITVSDILDKINYGELPAWFDGTGRYARLVYPASHYEPGSPGYSNQRHQTVDYLAIDRDPIMGLMGYYKISAGARSDLVTFVPIDEVTAAAHWNGGNLLLDRDDESLLQIVRRKSQAHISSRSTRDFIPDRSRLPHEKIWIAADDLRALLEADVDVPPLSSDLGTSERNALHKLLAAMAIKSYEYDPSRKRQGKGVISAVQDSLKALGISMSDDTVAKYLKEATSQFAPQGNPIEAMARQVTLQK